MKPHPDPLGLPNQTVPQLPEPETDGGDQTRTQAAPANYNVSAHTPPRPMSAIPVEVDRSQLIAMAGRYAIVKALAKGGMGQVSIARDTELDRDVALKEIQPKFKLDAATLHRFTLEARVTGKLEHPGVVPVYGLGTYPDGRPYYAMRFLSGESFQKSIDVFHEREALPRDPQERSMALRALLRRFIDVCNTIAFAHSRGILHRDIKPANVMLGSFGETLVVDWGLAKEMAAPPTIPVLPADPGETALHQMPEFNETKDGFTLYGQTMGTPAYMSPEQAAGKWDITGVASDVYSLGAMLYAILSGTPPYSGPSFEVITRVQRGEYKPVKLVKGSVPDPLDAIVRKAMAFEIRDRYSNALALAADVERWMADEPVSCYREPFLKRASRWARRHRTLVFVAGAVGLATLIALAVGIVAVNAERKRTVKAKNEAESARNEAVESRADAREALLTLTDDAVGEVLAGSQRPTPQQAKFLDSLIGMYSRFAQKEPDSPETKLFIAGAFYRIGRIEARLERYNKASEAYAKATERLSDPVLAVTPEARKTLGDVRLYEGIMGLQQGRPEAESKLRESAAIYRQLIETDPKPDYRYRLAQCEDRLGTFYLVQRNLPEAEKLFRSSLEGRLKLAEESPNAIEYQFRLAQSYRQLAGLCFRTGKASEGLELALKARAIQERVVAANPTSAAYLALFADIDTLLTEHFTQPRKLEQSDAKKPDKDPDAVRYARSAAKTWAALAGLNPGDTKFRQRQAEADINLARQCADNGQPRDAQAAIETALVILKSLDRDEPNNIVTQTKLVQAMVAEARVLLQLGDDGAREAADAAVAMAEGLSARLPKSAELHQHAASACLTRAGILLAAKKLNEAKANLDAAWPHVEAAARDGNSIAIQFYSRTLVDWMALSDDFNSIADASKRIAALPLPKGLSWFEAACLHGYVGLRLRKSPTPLDDAWQRFVILQLGESLHCLKEAAKQGFDRLDLLEGAPDLFWLREANEYREFVESLKARTKPGRVEN